MREIGIYVPDSELARLALFTFEEPKASNVDFDAFVDVRRLGREGVFELQNQKRRGTLVGSKKVAEPKEGIRRGPGRYEQLEAWKGEVDKVG